MQEGLDWKWILHSHMVSRAGRLARWAVTCRRSTPLTEQQAWDVAAFVNSQPRPHKDQKADWVDIAKKPIDFPFSPYADGFSQEQHKFGPFKDIAGAKKKVNN